MQPEGGGLPEGGVLQQIEKDFGSFTNFREEFYCLSLTTIGVWLGLALSVSFLPLSFMCRQY